MLLYASVYAIAQIWQEVGAAVITKITHDKKAAGQSIVKQIPGLMLFPAEVRCLQESSGNIHVRGLGGKYILLVLSEIWWWCFYGRIHH